MYKIPCECGKVNIGETRRYMHERIKKHDKDIRLSRTQTSAVSEHANKNGHYPLWDEVTFIYRDPHWYSRRVKEAVHIRLHPNNVNKDNMSTDLYHSGPLRDQFLPLTILTNNALDRNPPTMSEVCDAPITNNHSGTNGPTQ